MFFLLLLGITAYGQEEDISVSRGFSLSLTSSNRGSGLESAYYVGAGRMQWAYGLDIFHVRSLHEVKVEPYPFPDRKYVFGKINNLWVVSPSFGVNYMLSSSSSYNMVEMQGGIKIGPALGVLNPYHIKLCGQNGNCISEAFNPDIHSYQAISGRASVFSNTVDPSLRLGISLKAYVIFDFHYKIKNLTGIKLGINADLFPSSVPLVLETDDLQNASTYLAGTIGFIFGGKW